MKNKLNEKIKKIILTIIVIILIIILGILSKQFVQKRKKLSKPLVLVKKEP